MEQTYHSQILDHHGLVAGMFEELGIGDIIRGCYRSSSIMSLWDRKTVGLRT